jgi:hypothetical protein
MRTLVLILALLLGWVYHQEAMFRAEQRAHLSRSGRL